jgi:hypothetical protein
MSDVSISYKGAEIAALDASGTKTLLTSGKYCEGDIEVAYTKPSGGGGNPIEKTVYTHAQDWISDGTGNTAAFKNAYFTKGAGMYYATIENNNATGNYKGISAIAAIGGMLTADAYTFGRSGGNVNQAAGSWSYYITAGAIVSVWFIPKGAFV